MEDIKNMPVLFTQAGTKEKEGKEEEEGIILTLTKTESEFMLLIVSRYKAMYQDMRSSTKEFIEALDGIKEKIETGLVSFKAKDIILALTKTDFQWMLSIVIELKQLWDKHGPLIDEKLTIEVLDRIEDEMDISYTLFELKCVLMENKQRK